LRPLRYLRPRQQVSTVSQPVDNTAAQQDAGPRIRRGDTPSKLCRYTKLQSDRGRNSNFVTWEGSDAPARARSAPSRSTTSRCGTASRRRPALAQRGPMSSPGCTSAVL
jgi:hypothetical protein